MTSRRPAVATIRAPLSDLDRAVMQCVWDQEPCAVETVYRAVSQTRDLKEVTVRTVLRRLEQKGYVTHTVDGRAYVYRAAAAPRTLAARAVRAIVDTLCRGSVEELVNGLVEGDVLSNEELRVLEAAVRDHRQRAQARRKARR
jgi:BlaI family penicillinase repressor